MGSSDGWLVISGFYNHSIDLYVYNPFTNAKLRLPPINAAYVHKVILSSSPPPPAAVVVAIHAKHRGHSKLVVTRPGDKAWTDLKLHKSYEEEGDDADHEFGFQDVLFHGNKIYVLHCTLKVYVIQMDDDLQIDSSSYSILQPQPDFHQYQLPWSPYQYPCRSTVHLTASSNDGVLLVVQKFESEWVTLYRKFHDKSGYYAKQKRRKTIGFIVFKWESERWTQVRSLGEDQMLFIGPVSSFSVSSSSSSSNDRDLPMRRCSKGRGRGNRIYFIDYYGPSQTNSTSNYDRGVYSLEDDCIESSLPSPYDTGDDEPYRLPPTWLTYTSNDCMD